MMSVLVLPVTKGTTYTYTGVERAMKFEKVYDSPDHQNLHHVSGKEWKKWSHIRRMVFNETYLCLLRNDNVMCHPKAPNISESHWNTIAWNAAWEAGYRAESATKYCADGIANQMTPDHAWTDLERALYEAVTK